MIRGRSALALAIACAGGSAPPAGAAEVALSFAEAPGGVASGFRIERREEGGERFAPIALVGPGVAEFVDRGLPKDARYCYRVRALGSVDPEDWSPEVCAVAEDPAPVPPAAESAPPTEVEPAAPPPAEAPPPPAESAAAEGDAAPESGQAPMPAAPSAGRIRTTGGWLQVLDEP